MSIAFRAFEIHERKHGPSIDTMGPYFDDFWRFVVSAWPDVSEEERLAEALAHVTQLVADAEAERDTRAEVRALYLQQKLLLAQSRLQGGEST